MRRLVWTVGAVVFVDTMFYAVIAPLLPQLSHELHLSKLSAGILTACYPLGTLLAFDPGRRARGQSRPPVRAVHRAHAARLLDARVRLHPHPPPGWTWHD